MNCGRWIKRPENQHLVVLGKSFPKESSLKSTLEIFSFVAESSSLFSSPLATHVMEEGNPISIAVHPSGDHFVCTTTAGDCKVFELNGKETDVKVLANEMSPLQGIGLQKCVAFSFDGSRLATGGEDGHLRIFEWPSLRIILDEPRAHKSFRDMDFSLDSEFLASTSTDGSARIWNANEGVPITNLRRNSDEKIELCRFSMDGTKPFLFCTVQKGDKALTSVWDISTWKKIGNKRLLRKPASVMTVSMDGKYLAFGSKDGDICVAEVSKMQVRHWSKRLHLGSSIASLEFCPSERVVLTTTTEWGALVSKLTVPKDWKDWQIYTLLLCLFLASGVLFYIFFLVSDSFWNFPVPETSKQNIETLFSDSHLTDDPNFSGPFGPLDM